MRQSKAKLRPHFAPVLTAGAGEGEAGGNAGPPSWEDGPDQSPIHGEPPWAHKRYRRLEGAEGTCPCTHVLGLCAPHPQLQTCPDLETFPLRYKYPQGPKTS